MKPSDLKSLLARAYAENAADVMISAGAPPSMRIDGLLVPAEEKPLDGTATRDIVCSLLTAEQVTRLDRDRELDFSLFYEGHRFRVNAYWQSGSVAMVLRLIPDEIPRPEQLGLPRIVIDLLHKPQGLILVTGASNQGKTTSQAAMIDFLNRSVPKHVITIEDPVEFAHHSKRCIVDQREVGIDTLSFAEALRHALRQSPDILLVGEMRDPETIRAALTAAETGHLVMSTLHTNDSCQALDRIIDTFPEHQQVQVRSQLSLCLLAVLAQRLVRSRDGKLVLAPEVLINTRAVAHLIHDGKINQIYGMIETGSQYGMQTMNQALETLLAEKKITRAEAAKYMSAMESAHAAAS